MSKEGSFMVLAPNVVQGGFCLVFFHVLKPVGWKGMFCLSYIPTGLYTQASEGDPDSKINIPKITGFLECVKCLEWTTVEERGYKEHLLSRQ